MRQTPEDGAAWAVIAVARTTSAAGEGCCVGVWPDRRAMDRRVEALAVVLLAGRLVEGSLCLFEKVLLLRHHGMSLMTL